jgi:hypothetical protein
MDHQYDVCLSFAGEQRNYVDQVAANLRERGIRVFYDDFEQVSLWGKDLYEHLDWVYRKAARYCVLFASADYARKVWTNHERQSAQARALEANREYVLPTRFDDTEIPGLRPTVAYVDLRRTTAAELGELIQTKLGPRSYRNFFPPVPDKLFEALDAETDEQREAVQFIGLSFMRALRRMTVQERNLLAEIFVIGCKEELPENVHVSLDLVRRDLEVAPAECLTLLRGMRSLGVMVALRRAEDGDPVDELVVVSWNDSTSYDEDSVAEDMSFERSTEIAVRMVELGNSYCAEHTLAAIEQLDFSELSSSTTKRL